MSAHAVSFARSVPQRLRGLRKLFVVVTLLIVCGAIFRSAIATRLDGFTLDEAYHIAAGVSYVRDLDFRINPEHPPLVKLWVGSFISATGFHLSRLRPSASLRSRMCTCTMTSTILGNDQNVSSTLPISAFQMAQWLYRQNLNNTPRATNQANYSNAGYMLLGLIVARMRGAPDFISGLATLLRSLQITRVRSSVSVATSQPGDEARYHSRPLATAKSVMVTGQPLCAQGYGDGNLENAGGGGGLSAAVTDVARMLAALSAFDNQMMSSATLLTWLTNAKNATANLTGPNAHGYHGFDSVKQDPSTHEFSGVKGGYLDTSQNGVMFTQNGISTVMCWNGLTPKGPAWSPIYNALVNAATEHNWGNTDLFSTYGMPAFLAPIPTPVPRPPRPGPPIIFRTPSHMLPQTERPKYM